MLGEGAKKGELVPKEMERWLLAQCKTPQCYCDTGAGRGELQELLWPCAVGLCHGHSVSRSQHLISPGTRDIGNNSQMLAGQAGRWWP